MVQLPRAPSVSGKRMPMSFAASWSVSSTTPASATATRLSALIERMRFMRRSDSRSAEPSAGGVAPPAMPVLPPCGTSGTRCSAASLTMAATSSVEAGARIAGAAPCTRPRQSLSHGAISRRSVITPLGPSTGPASAISWLSRRSCRHAAWHERAGASKRRHGPAAITLIVARAQNGVIGRDGELPWHLPADLKRFKALTMGSVMVMGRRTFDSLPGLLPGRRHVVLTRDQRLERAGRGGRAQRRGSAWSWRGRAGVGDRRSRAVRPIPAAGRQDRAD